MRAADVKAAITGGVSGLGLATAKRIVADGGQVTLLDVNKERGAEAVAEIDGAHFVACDVTDEGNVSQAVGEAQKSMSGLNVLVGCAGVGTAFRALGRNGPAALADFSRVIQINLVGTFNAIKAAVNLMQDNEPGDDGERGVIINTASVAAYEGQIGQAAYSASKGGVVGMTLPLAREFGRMGVRVMTIAPGVFHTPMVGAMPPEVQESLNAQVPFPSRLGSSNEYADTAAFILGNRYVNGGTIRVDGAIRMQPK